MKQFIFISLLSSLFCACGEIKPHTWYLNACHPGVVIECDVFDRVKTLDSGVVYISYIDGAMWVKIHEGDTIKHFGTQ